MAVSVRISEAPISLDRDIFMRSLIGELSLTLEDVVGIEEASGFISVVGRRMGKFIDDDYRRALCVKNLSRGQVTDVLIDLKRRIDGDFFIIEENDEKIVLGNRRCPFGDKVLGRTSMCMMTSNVFGSIAANNLGYAKVSLRETIAQGDNGCRVEIYLRPSPESDRASGVEYAGLRRREG